MVPFGIPDTSTAFGSTPGSKAIGWPRLTGAGLKPFRGPAGTETVAKPGFTYPKRAVYVVAPGSTQDTDTLTATGGPGGSSQDDGSETLTERVSPPNVPSMTPSPLPGFA